MRKYGRILRYFVTSLALLITLIYISISGTSKKPAKSLRNNQVDNNTKQLKTIIKNESKNGQTFPNSKAKIIYLATLYYGEDWFQNFKGDFILKHCSIPDCRVTKSKSELNISEVVVFHARDINMGTITIPRYIHQYWTFYTLEPPWLEILDWRELDGLFNWTMSYRQDSDVVVSYGSIEERSSVPRDEPLLTLKKKKRDAAVWFVSNCCTESRREKYILLLRSYYKVDVFGGCGRDSCRPANSKKCYLKIARSYKFYFSFENAICKDYVTEKFFNILNYSIIPVVFGGAIYSSIAPPGSYIDATKYPDPKDLADYLWKVSSDESLYNSYFDWKSHYKLSLHHWVCSLCEKLHSGKQRPISVVKDFYSWWIKEANCKQWASKGFLPVNSTVMPCYHTHNFKTQSKVDRKSPATIRFGLP